MRHLNWRRVGALFAAANGAVALLVVAAARQANRDHSEPEFRWTDKNRWE